MYEYSKEGNDAARVQMQARQAEEDRKKHENEMRVLKLKLEGIQDELFKLQQRKQRLNTSISQAKVLLEKENRDKSREDNRLEQMRKDLESKKRQMRALENAIQLEERKAKTRSEVYIPGSHGGGMETLEEEMKKINDEEYALTRKMQLLEADIRNKARVW